MLKRQCRNVFYMYTVTVDGLASTCRSTCTAEANCHIGTLHVHTVHTGVQLLRSTGATRTCSSGNTTAASHVYMSCRLQATGAEDWARTPQMTRLACLLRCAAAHHLPLAA